MKKILPEVVLYLATIALFLAISTMTSEGN